MKTKNCKYLSVGDFRFCPEIVALAVNAYVCVYNLFYSILVLYIIEVLIYPIYGNNKANSFNIQVFLSLFIYLFIYVYIYCCW